MKITVVQDGAARTKWRPHALTGTALALLVVVSIVITAIVAILCRR